MYDNIYIMNHSNRLDKHENLIAALLRRIDKLEQVQHTQYLKNKGRIYKVLNYGQHMTPASDVTPTASAKFVAPKAREEDVIVEAIKDLEISVPAATPAVAEPHIEYLQNVGLGVFRY